MKLNWIVVAGILGALGIAMGAFGAHALPDHLETTGYDSAEIAKRLETFETGARYHMYAALAMLAVGVAQQRGPRTVWSAANGLLLLGTVIFSGLLYAIAVLSDDYRWLGMIVPIGGLMMIAGWVAVAVGAGGDKA